MKIYYDYVRQGLLTEQEAKEYTEQEAFNIETNCKRLIDSKNNVQK